MVRRADGYPRLRSAGALARIYKKGIWNPSAPAPEAQMRIIVAITGATGAAYGVRLLAALEQLGVERHLIVSRWAEVTLLKETGYTAREIGAMASVVHSRDNQGAPLASGSFRHDGMIVAPCSMK